MKALLEHVQHTLVSLSLCWYWTWVVLQLECMLCFFCWWKNGEKNKQRDQIKRGNRLRRKHGRVEEEIEGTRAASPSSRIPLRVWHDERLCGRFFSALMKVGDHGLIDTTSAPVWSRGNCFPSLHSPRYISNSISLSLEEAGGENVSLWVITLPLIWLGKVYFSVDFYNLTHTEGFCVLFECKGAIVWWISQCIIKTLLAVWVIWISILHDSFLCSLLFYLGGIRRKIFFSFSKIPFKHQSHSDHRATWSKWGDCVTCYFFGKCNFSSNQRK